MPLLGPCSPLGFQLPVHWHVVLPQCIEWGRASHQELKILLFPARCIKQLRDDVSPDLRVPLALLCCTTVEGWKSFLHFEVLLSVLHPLLQACSHL